MSNYHVEPASKPQALTKEAIKALRHEQVQGVSRRELLRGSPRPPGWACGCSRSRPARSASCGRTSRGFGGEVRSGPRDVKAANTSLPIDEGYPAYFTEARRS
jgi:hypothetical protein